MLLAVITCIIKVRASQQSFSSILGDATIIGITVLQRISISRNIGSSKLQVIEDSLIYFLHWSTWDVCLRRFEQQRHITKQTSQIEIEDATKSTSLTHDTALGLGIAIPLDDSISLNQLIATVDGLIIILPICIEEVIIRWCDGQIKLVDSIIVLGIRKSQASESLLRGKLCRQVHADTFIAQCTLPSIVAAYKIHVCCSWCTVSSLGIHLCLR